jgi:hypothetical protein
MQRIGGLARPIVVCGRIPTSLTTKANGKNAVLRVPGRSWDKRGGTCRHIVVEAVSRKDMADPLAEEEKAVWQWSETSDAVVTYGVFFIVR